MCALCMHRHLERETKRRENWKILFGSIQGNTSQTCYCTHLAVWLLFPASFCSLGPLLFLLLTKALASRFCRFLVCRKNFFVLSGTIKKFLSFISVWNKKESWRRKTKPSQSKRRGKSEVSWRGQKGLHSIVPLFALRRKCSFSALPTEDDLLSDGLMQKIKVAAHVKGFGNKVLCLMCQWLIYRGNVVCWKNRKIHMCDKKNFILWRAAEESEIDNKIIYHRICFLPSPTATPKMQLTKKRRT